MEYKKCRDCEYRCTCCSSRFTNLRCSGCECHYDEFAPADFIHYCPKDGKKIEEDNE